MAAKRKGSEPPAPFLGLVTEIARVLESLGLHPVLVGGMALVLLGSRRVTRGFDFVIAQPGEQLAEALDAFYDRGLELAAKLNATGEVTATIGNRRVAAARLRLDRPESAFFQDPKSGLRIDVLFDFPILAGELAGRSVSAKTPVGKLRIASEADLLRLKTMARANRSVPTDDQDIAFLESRRNAP
ncbi:MAG: hypothetical protein R3E75_01785 [Steroidobacteraceae bacterium]|nr:hypothetical protein [Nevskiaceae bacterium]MCP5360363.1 hypothetical protein [Nevskiaceae bacterium]MCP5467289.1 hypothetical protein [Nevskiaceae bacterium]MCP5471136.1 hypothetical protein [Nevskiaceae bacterium]